MGKLIPGYLVERGEFAYVIPPVVERDGKPLVEVSVPSLRWELYLGPFRSAAECQQTWRVAWTASCAPTYDHRSLNW